MEHSDLTKKTTNVVVGREKKTAVESAYMTKQYVKKIRYKKTKTKEQLKSSTKSSKKETNIKEKHADI